MSPATGTSQKLSMLSHGNATSRAPICSGITMLPSDPVTSGISTSHTIVGAVHREHLIEGVVAHERPLGVHELDAHQLGERAGDDHEQQPGHEVLNPDHLVIEREDVLRDEPFRRGMDMVVRLVMLGCAVRYSFHGMLLAYF